MSRADEMGVDLAGAVGMIRYDRACAVGLAGVETTWLGQMSRGDRSREGLGRVVGRGRRDSGWVGPSGREEGIGFGRSRNCRAESRRGAMGWVELSRRRRLDLSRRSSTEIRSGHHSPAAMSPPSSPKSGGFSHEASQRAESSGVGMTSATGWSSSAWCSSYAWSTA